MKLTEGMKEIIAWIRDTGAAFPDNGHERRAFRELVRIGMIRAERCGYVFTDKGSALADNLLNGVGS